MRMVLRFLILSLLLFPLMAFALNIDDIEFPPGTEVRSAGRNLVHNGSRLEIRLLSSDWTRMAFIKYMRAAIKNKSSGNKTPSFLENEVGLWSTISVLSSNKSLVLQISDDEYGHAHGILSELELTGAGKGHTDSSVELMMPDVFEGMSHLANTNLISETVAGKDKFRSSVHESNRVVNPVSRTSVMSNSFSVSRNQRFYIESMVRDNWQLKLADNHHENASLLFSSQSEQCEISIVPMNDGNSLITIVRTSNTFPN